MNLRVYAWKSQKPGYESHSGPDSHSGIDPLFLDGDFEGDQAALTQGQGRVTNPQRLDIALLGVKQEVKLLVHFCELVDFSNHIAPDTMVQASLSGEIKIVLVPKLTGWTVIFFRCEGLRGHALIVILLSRFS